jgi:hypothetical protein
MGRGDGVGILFSSILGVDVLDDCTGYEARKSAI